MTKEEAAEFMKKNHPDEWRALDHFSSLIKGSKEFTLNLDGTVLMSALRRHYNLTHSGEDKTEE